MVINDSYPGIGGPKPVDVLQGGAPTPIVSDVESIRRFDGSLRGLWYGPVTADRYVDHARESLEPECRTAEASIRETLGAEPLVLRISTDGKTRATVTSVLVRPREDLKDWQPPTAEDPNSYRSGFVVDLGLLVFKPVAAENSGTHEGMRRYKKEASYSGDCELIRNDDGTYTYSVGDREQKRLPLVDDTKLQGGNTRDTENSRSAVEKLAYLQVTQQRADTARDEIAKFLNYQLNRLKDTPTLLISNASLLGIGTPSKKYNLVGNFVRSHHMSGRILVEISDPRTDDIIWASVTRDSSFETVGHCDFHGKENFWPVDSKLRQKITGLVGRLARASAKLPRLG